MSVEAKREAVEEIIKRVRDNAESRPFIALFSFTLITVFILSVIGKIKLDGWTVIVLLIAVAPWCWKRILSAIDDLIAALKRNDISSVEVGSLKLTRLEQRVDQQQVVIDEQREIIDDIVLYSMAFYLYELLRHLHLGTSDPGYGPIPYRDDAQLQRDLLYLLENGFTELFGFTDFAVGDNLVGRIVVTDTGRRFVERREERDRAKRAGSASRN